MLVDKLDLTPEVVRVAQNPRDDRLVRAGEERVIAQPTCDGFADGILIRALFGARPARVNQTASGERRNPARDPPARKPPVPATTSSDPKQPNEAESAQHARNGVREPARHLWLGSAPAAS